MNYCSTKYLAPRKTRDNIQHDAYLIRRKFGYDRERYFPISEFLELVLPLVDPDFHLQIVEDRELPGVMAETFPELHCMRIKQSVYDAASKDHAWARMVLAHELGHYLYHEPQNISYAKLEYGQKVPRNRDPEWQATVFGAELLAPSGFIKGQKICNPSIVARDFCVSDSAARTQFSVAHRSAGSRGKNLARQNVRPNNQS